MELFEARELRLLLRAVGGASRGESRVGTIENIQVKIPSKRLQHPGRTSLANHRAWLQQQQEAGASGDEDETERLRRKIERLEAESEGLKETLLWIQFASREDYIRVNILDVILAKDRMSMIKRIVTEGRNKLQDGDSPTYEKSNLKSCESDSLRKAAEKFHITQNQVEKFLIMQRRVETFLNMKRRKRRITVKFHNMLTRKRRKKIQIQEQNLQLKWIARQRQNG